MADESGLIWRKSGFCGTNACIEIAIGVDAVLVRDSADAEGARLAFEPAGWAEFLGEVTSGRLDRPAA